MSQVIMIGCDLHDGSMLWKIAEGRQAPETRSVKNTTRGRAKMIADLQRRAKAAGAERIRARNPKHKKIAVVASTRRLAIRLWHRGVAADEGLAWLSLARLRPRRA
jgi:hypothetical protein